MGSVQSEIECPKCKYPRAFEDYYYKSGEVYIFCQRCGFCFSAFIKLDPAYGRQRKAQTEALIKEGKIDEALKASANEGWVSHRNGKDVPIAEVSGEIIRSILSRFKVSKKVDANFQKLKESETKAKQRNYQDDDPIDKIIAESARTGNKRYDSIRHY